MIALTQIKNLGFILLLTFVVSCEYPGTLQVESKSLNSPEDIIEITSSQVKPIDYTNAISLKELSIKEKKKKFIDLILPAILLAKHELAIEQYEVKKFINKDTSKLCDKNKKFLKEMFKKFKADNLNTLLYKMETHPTSIVIAQAAIESGWGTSRFYLEANNIFGVWSFNSNESRVKSIFSREGKDIYLRKYENLHMSVLDYFLTIARGPYSEFRAERLVSQDPAKLIPYLINYSEKREEYIQSLQKLITKNDLTKYDSYKIDSRYIIRYW